MPRELTHYFLIKVTFDKEVTQGEALQHFRLNALDPIRVKSEGDSKAPTLMTIRAPSVVPARYVSQHRPRHITATARAVGLEDGS